MQFLGLVLLTSHFKEILKNTNVDEINFLTFIYINIFYAFESFVACNGDACVV